MSTSILDMVLQSFDMGINRLRFAKVDLEYAIKLTCSADEEIGMRKALAVIDKQLLAAAEDRQRKIARLSR